jgi:short-subunit dehydrogenase
MTTRSIKLDRQQFGPWAVVTGASSGIGRGFATQLAASGINVVLAARRPEPLEQVGGELASRYGVRYRAVQVDLSAPDFMAPLLDATDDLDVGLIVSNAGDAGLGEFLNAGHNTLLTELRLNAEVHLSLAHHFGQRLTGRGGGGILLVSSLLAAQGVPYVANYSATKAYTLVLGESLHHELAPHGVHVTVLVPGPTQTPMMGRLAADKTIMARMTQPVDAVVAEGLAALKANRPVRISGAMNRLTVAMAPRSVRTRIFGTVNKSMAAHVAAREAAMG